jgi:hypothetical protein
MRFAIWRCGRSRERWRFRSSSNCLGNGGFAVDCCGDAESGDCESVVYSFGNGKAAHYEADGKLGVSYRMEVVVQANELSLLQLTATLSGGQYFLHHLQYLATVRSNVL